MKALKGTKSARRSGKRAKAGSSRRKVVPGALAPTSKFVKRDNTLANWVAGMTSRRKAVRRGNTLADWARSAL